MTDLKPLPSGCVKNLSDKLFEKRKAGAIEVEQLVKNLITKDKLNEVEKIITYFSVDFIVSLNCHVRKGGLIGLASVTIGLGQKSIEYSNLLLLPVLQTFRDSDARVRYFACESLYNMMKIFKCHSLQYLNDIFESLSIASADPEPSVRQVAGHCDRLLRDIVIQNESIDMPSFLPLICERIYTPSPFGRQFLVCWITTLNSVPTLNVLHFLPQFLDGLFNILGDSNSEIRQKCELLLSNFLDEIVKNPSITDISAMVNILIAKCSLAAATVSAKWLENKSISQMEPNWATNGPFAQQSSPERLQQVTALVWLQKFVESPGLHLLSAVAPIISAVLPSLYDETADKTAVEIAIRINETLMKLAHSVQPVEVNGDEIARLSKHVDKMVTVDQFSGLDCFGILKVIYSMFNHVSVLTRLASLRWVEVLVSVCHHLVFPNVEELLPRLLKLLSDPATEVVHASITLVGCLCRHPAAKQCIQNRDALTVLSTGNATTMVKTVPSLPGVVEANPLTLRFLIDLVNLFIADHEMVTDRGDLVITDLCLALGAKSVYFVLSIIVSDLLQPNDAFLIVQIANRILLTQSNLSDFRTYLRSLNTQTDVTFFQQLYRAWCHNPVALLSLCLLTQNYSNCRQLIKSFGELAISVEVLVEMDQLIQLIESPVFATLRLHLIDKRHSATLQETLYCLLMCLPQTEAFETLRRRLQCLPSYTLTEHDRASETVLSQPAGVNFEALLAHFHKVQKQHYEFRVKTSLTATPTDSHLQTSETDADRHSKKNKMLDLEFLHIPNNSQPKVTATEFLIHGLEKLGISVVPQPGSTNPST